MITRTVYETYDGKFFEDEKSAIEHETELKEKQTKKVLENIKSIKEYCSGTTCYECKIKSLCYKFWKSCPSKDWEIE